MGTLRKSYLRKRRKRKEELGKLRAAYQLARTKEEKEKILSKVTKIAPHLTVEEFLAPITKE